MAKNMEGAQGDSSEEVQAALHGNSESDMEAEAQDDQGFTLVQNRKKRISSLEGVTRAHSDGEDEVRKSKRMKESERGHGTMTGRRPTWTEQRATSSAQAAATTRPSPSAGPTPQDGQVRSSQTTRKRMLFPADTQLTYHEKMLWAARLARAHKNLEVLFKEGKHRPYVTVGSQEAVEFLSTTSFEDVTLQVPEDKEKLTKVIIFRYPIGLDPGYLLDDPAIVWAKRNVVRGEERTQVIAMLKGKVPGSIFIPGIGYRRLAPYFQVPKICLNCSRWGHEAYRCEEDSRCRFCGKKHKSELCGQKIKNGERVTPRCANCGLEHNARSPLCLMNPKTRRLGAVGATRQEQGQRGNTATGAPESNVAQDRGEAVRPTAPPPPPLTQGEGQEGGNADEEWPRLRVEGNETTTVPSPPPVTAVSVDRKKNGSGARSRGDQVECRERRSRGPSTASESPVFANHEETVKSIKCLEKEVGSLKKGISVILDKIEKLGEEKAEARCSDVMAGGGAKPRKSGQREPLISVGVDFETLLKKWKANGKNTEPLAAQWEEVQRCLEAASKILECIAIECEADNDQNNGPA